MRSVTIKIKLTINAKIDKVSTDRKRSEYKMARDEKVIIRLTDDIKSEFQQIAEEMGMTISALGSYVIGAYIREQKNKVAFQEKMISPMVETMSKISLESIDNKQLAGVLSMLSGKLNESEQNRP